MYSDITYIKVLQYQASESTELTLYAQSAANYTTKTAISQKLGTGTLTKSMFVVCSFVKFVPKACLFISA